MLCIQNCLTSLGLFARETIQDVANFIFSFVERFKFYLLTNHTKSHENTIKWLIMGTKCMVFDNFNK